ncbi:MAG: GNAT family N-acetyltransferase [Sphingomonadaceae bacterium]
MNSKQMEILPLDPYSTAARELLALSDAYMASLYPAESNHMESPASLAGDNVVFVGVHVDGQLAGCGAVKIGADDVPYGEIKRVFVPEQHRGRGYSQHLMLHLESALKARKIDVVRLETGISQPEALGLYRKLGYVERSPFGSYQPDPLSIFMEKRLAG